MRLIWNVIISLTIMLIICATGNSIIHGNESQDDFTYELISRGGDTYAYLKRYIGSAEYVSLPAQIDGYPVIGIGESFLFLNNYTVKTIYIPKSIVEMPQAAFITAYNLERFILEDEDESGFHTIDEALYFRNNLVAYPPAKEGNSLVIPENTSIIFRSAFYGCKNLRKVVVPSSVIHIGLSAFSRSKQSMEIYIKKTNISGADYLNLAFWEMAIGTKVLVNNEELKQMFRSQMTDTEAYADHRTNPRIMEVDVGRIPADSLNFIGGDTTLDLTMSKGEVKNVHEYYVQNPVDTTELVLWTSNDPSVAAVDMWGKLQVFRGGNAEITGRNESGHTLTIQLKAEMKMASFELYGLEEPIKSGEERKLNAEILPKDCYADYMGIVWKNTNPKVVQMTIDHNRQLSVRGMHPGTSELIGTVNDNGVQYEKRFQIEVSGDIRESTADELPDMVYGGTPLTPKPILYFQGIRLREGKDYEISGYYANNRPGIGTIVILGRGNYRDIREESWNPLYVYFRIIEDSSASPPVLPLPPINPPVIPPDMMPVPPPEPDSPSQPQIPWPPQVPEAENLNALRVGNAKKSYAKNKSFYMKVENASNDLRFYSSNKKVVTIGKNTGKVTVKGAGTAVIKVRSGDETAYGTVIIVPATNQIKSLDSFSRGRLRMVWQSDRLADGYQIQLSNKKDFSVITKTWTISEKKTERRTIRSPIRRKTVYIRVRSYIKIGEITYYGNFSKKQKIRAS